MRAAQLARGMRHPHDAQHGGSTAARMRHPPIRTTHDAQQQHATYSMRRNVINVSFSLRSARFTAHSSTSSRTGGHSSKNPQR